MAGYFITGAGTDIGKTFVAAGLTRQLKKCGRTVDVLKPVVSGFDPANPAGSDPAVLLEALGLPLTDKNLAKISPWRFRAPLSTDMAAALETRTIDFAEVTDFCRRAVAGAKDALLIEGVGGVMAPLDARRTFLELIAALDLPVLFVSGTYLGAISHALCGLGVIAGRGLAVRAVVVNETPGSSVDFDMTLKTLANFVTAPLAPMRRGDPTAFERLAEFL